MKTLLTALFLFSMSFGATAYYDECEYHERGEEEEECPIHNVPEIDGATLPKAALLLICLYLLAVSTRPKQGE